MTFDYEAYKRFCIELPPEFRIPIELSEEEQQAEIIALKRFM
jgi:hypothetical protein